MTNIPNTDIAADKNLVTQVRYIDNYSVVRLPDGRAGVLCRRTARKRPMVRITPNYAMEVSPSDSLEVVTPAQNHRCWVWPAQLA